MKTSQMFSMAFREFEIVGLRGGEIGVVLGSLVEDTTVMPLNVRASGLSGFAGGVELGGPVENLTVGEVGLVIRLA